MMMKRTLAATVFGIGMLFNVSAFAQSATATNGDVTVNPAINTNTSITGPTTTTTISPTITGPTTTITGPTTTIAPVVNSAGGEGGKSDANASASATTGNSTSNAAGGSATGGSVGSVSPSQTMVNKVRSIATTVLPPAIQGTINGCLAHEGWSFGAGYMGALSFGRQTAEWNEKCAAFMAALKTIETGIDTGDKVVIAAGISNLSEKYPDLGKALERVIDAMLDYEQSGRAVRSASDLLLTPAQRARRLGIGAPQ